MPVLIACSMVVVWGLISIGRLLDGKEEAEFGEQKRLSINVLVGLLLLLMPHYTIIGGGLSLVAVMSLIIIYRYPILAGSLLQPMNKGA